MTMFVQPLQNLNENKADQKVNEKRTFVNPVFDGADPWFVKKDGYYYYCFSSKNAISISRSQYLTRTGEPVQVWKTPEEGWQRDVRLQSFRWDKKGYPVFGEPVAQGIRMKRPSGEYRLEKKSGKE
jgi:GH43 family beta-xylosidase